jgi:hypothetical protein
MSKIQVCSMNGEKTHACRMLVAKPRGKGPLGGSKIFNIKMVWMAMIWLRTGTSGGLLKKGNEPSGSVQFRNFLSSFTIWGF